MGARVYNPATNQFTSPDPVTGGNETSYTYPNDPINKTDFDGNWGWGDTLDLALTVASFLPIPGLQQIAWVAKAASLALRVGKAGKLFAKLAKWSPFNVVKSKSLTALPSRAKGPGIYEFEVKGKVYVGQSNNVARRLREHSRKYGPDSISNIRVRKMPNSNRLDRREAEQARINLYRQNGTVLENKIDAIKRN
jgi:hypothetical protein